MFPRRSVQLVCPSLTILCFRHLAIALSLLHYTHLLSPIVTYCNKFYTSSHIRKNNVIFLSYITYVVIISYPTQNIHTFNKTLQMKSVLEMLAWGYNGLMATQKRFFCSRYPLRRELCPAISSKAQGFYDNHIDIRCVLSFLFV